MRSDQPTVQTSVIGVVPPGQLRRGFLYYVERQRAHPYRPALHYNSWYDVSWPGHRMNEAECMAVIEMFGRELTAKRGVRLQCFLWDDGWDDPATLWRIDQQDFPRGFAPMLAAAQAGQRGWASGFGPWGGYGAARKKRVEDGRKQGFEIVEAQFLDGRAELLPAVSGDFALLDQGERLRPLQVRRHERRPDRGGRRHGPHHRRAAQGPARTVRQPDDRHLAVAVLPVARRFDVARAATTWASPGAGSKRQQWVNYRDAETYRGVVLKAVRSTRSIRS